MRSYFDEDVVTTSQYIWYVCARRQTTVLVQSGPAFSGLMQLVVVAFLPLDCAARRGGSGSLPPTTTSLARFRRRRAARSPASERSFIYPLPN